MSSGKSSSNSADRSAVVQQSTQKQHLHHHYRRASQSGSASTIDLVAVTASSTTTAVPAITATTTISPMIVAATTINTNITMAPPPCPPPIKTATELSAKTKITKHRHKVKEFNDVISCSLCHGYLVNATTVDYCVHSFCRSCIVKHLQENKFCPQCRPGSKQINFSNLKSDERLKSLVFKIVPGLYQREYQRQMEFLSENALKAGENVDENLLSDQCSDDEYFSPVEPISLSLEYHPKSLPGSDQYQIPPVRYLQCPAAVTVHHLKRFISSKFDIDLQNQRVDIEIIYEDEILPEDFSLMDVGYCYSWKRTAPMRFFYRIFVCNVYLHTNQVVTSDSILSESSRIIDDCKSAKKSNVDNDSAQQKVVRFKDMPEVAYYEKSSNDKNKNSKVAHAEESKTKYTVFKTKSNKSHYIDNNISFKSNNNNNPIKDGLCVKTNNSDINGGKGPVKMTIIARKPNEMKVKQEPIKIKSITVRSLASTVVSSSGNGDFKSLRSNDMRYMNNFSDESSEKQKSTGSSTGKSSPRTETAANAKKCDIVVSIPGHSGHRSSNSSDDSFENLSLAQLKTAGKKVNPVFIKSISLDDSTIQRVKQRQDVPKLKIELPSLKTKLTVPKISPENQEKRKEYKIRKLSSDDSPVTVTTQVDITTYAKNIGLKPIRPIVDETNNATAKNASSIMASSASSSSFSSGQVSESTSSPFVFVDANAETGTSHKKRKKSKHSKEPKDANGKRRKLHAEISSQPAEESLKLKVKITGNHKSYKTERKTSSSSDDVVITSPLPATLKPMEIAPPPVVSATTSAKPIAAATTSTKPIASTHSPVVASGNQYQQKSILNIPNVNKAAKNNVTANSKSAIGPLPHRTSFPMTTVYGRPLNNAPKPIQPRLVSLQETALTPSPPLPPSLFKSTPMTMQTVTSVPPTIASRSAQQSQRAALNRMPQKPQLNKPNVSFVVPNPPRLLPHSPLLSPISSIASSAHRQAAQLKRSASLDSNSTVAAKQRKAEPNRTAVYTSFVGKYSNSPVARSPPPMVPTSKNSVPYTSSMGASYTHEVTALKIMPILFPPPGKATKASSGLYITSNTQQETQQKKPALEIVAIQPSAPPLSSQKAVTASNNTVKLSPTKANRPPPPPIPLVKIKKTVSPGNPLKPILTTVHAPIQRSTTQPNVTPKSPTATNAVTPPTTPPSSASPPVALQTLNGDLAPKSPESKQKSGVGNPASEIIAPLDLSGKPSRSPSLEKNTPPGTPPMKPATSPSTSAYDQIFEKLTACLEINKNSQDTTNKNSVINPTPAADTNSESEKPTKLPDTKKSSDSTDAAIKSSETVKPSEANSDLPSLDGSTNSKQISDTKESKSTETTETVATGSVKNTDESLSNALNSKNLQNLKMLSDSATNREKITIKNQRQLPMLSKLNDTNKLRMSPAVRQQNASVRNIPNPSALAFRSQPPPLPMLACITKTTSPSKATSNSSEISSTSEKKENDTESISAVVQQTPTNDIPKKTETSSTTVTTTKPIPALTAVTAATSSLDPQTISKKNLHLEQLAANLNLRAAAAADMKTSSSSNNIKAVKSVVDNATKTSIVSTTDTSDEKLETKICPAIVTTTSPTAPTSSMTVSSSTPSAPIATATTA